MRAAAFLQRRRVALSWLLAVMFALLADPAPWSVLAGAAVMALGAAVRTWASGHIRKKEELAVTGPYARTRNPLYLGSFLMALGALVMGRSAAAAVLAALFVVPLYGAVIRREEAFLEEKFGQAFRDYRSSVPLLLPRIFLPEPRRGGFDWSLVRRHHEWRAWAGALAVTVLMLVKYYWS